MSFGASKGTDGHECGHSQEQETELENRVTTGRAKERETFELRATSKFFVPLHPIESHRIDHGRSRSVYYLLTCVGLQCELRSRSRSRSRWCVIRSMRVATSHPPRAACPDDDSRLARVPTQGHTCTPRSRQERPLHARVCLGRRVEGGVSSRFRYRPRLLGSATRPPAP